MELTQLFKGYYKKYPTRPLPFAKMAFLQQHGVKGLSIANILTNGLNTADFVKFDSLAEGDVVIYITRADYQKIIGESDENDKSNENEIA